MAELDTAWRTWRFEQIALNVKDRVDDPSASGVDHYVGLEHLDPDSLRIRRWGSPEDVSATKLLFEPGDIIFGRRRAYQRKLGVAEFRGIASAHSLVLRAKRNVALPEFLPFFMQSDLFMDRALKISVGSLSPTINWKTLAKQEFKLPPVEAQRSIAERLVAIEAAMVALEEVAHQAEEALSAESQWWATAGHRNVDERGVVLPAGLPSGWRLLTTRELCDGPHSGLTLGPFGSSLTVKDYGHLDEGTPVLFVADVRRYSLAHVSQKFISPQKHRELSSHEALPGDVLVTEMGWPPGEACIVPEGWPPSIIKADLIRARVNRDVVLPEYLVLVLNSHWGQQQLVRISPGTTRPRMTLRDFERVRIAVPPLGLQREAIERTAALRSAASEAAERASACRTVKSTYLASIWGGA